jgi:hypothetical protein
LGRPKRNEIFKRGLRDCVNWKLHLVASGLTIKLTHECRQQDSRIANPHGAALIACSVWFGPGQVDATKRPVLLLATLLAEGGHKPPHLWTALLVASENGKAVHLL